MSLDLSIIDITAVGQRSDKLANSCIFIDMMLHKSYDSIRHMMGTHIPAGAKKSTSHVYNLATLVKQPN